jgi:hypothetical protein
MRSHSKQFGPVLKKKSSQTVKWQACSKLDSVLSKAEIRIAESAAIAAEHPARRFGAQRTARPTSSHND